MPTQKYLVKCILSSSKKYAHIINIKINLVLERQFLIKINLLPYVCYFFFCYFNPHLSSDNLWLNLSININH